LLISKLGTPSLSVIPSEMLRDHRAGRFDSTLGVVAHHGGIYQASIQLQSLETCLRARPRFSYFRGYIDLVLAYFQMQMELKSTVVGVYMAIR
jgi:hypothetical protein